MSTPIQQHLLTSNATYASSFPSSSSHTGTSGVTDPLSTPAPAKHYAIVTCMDARIDAFRAFGLALCDAHVIRNGGGSARDALRSLVLSNQLLGTREIFVIKHTDCGMTHFKEDGVAREKIGEGLGEEARREAEAMEWGGFGDEEVAVREDVEFLRGSRLIGEEVVISGWVYDVKTGRVRKVV